MVFFDLGTSAGIAEVPRQGNDGGARWARFVSDDRFGVS